MTLVYCSYGVDHFHRDYGTDAVFAYDLQDDGDHNVGTRNHDNTTLLLS